MLALVLSFLMSFALVFSIMPAIVRIAVNKRLVALPEERSSHEKITPCIGGVPVFLGMLFTTLLLTPAGQWGTLQFILSSLVIVFMVGIKDDIEHLPAYKKIIGLVVAITIVITRGEVRLEQMYGLFGLDGDFPVWLSLPVSAFTLLVITNAMNLIDGINGLAATVGLIALICFGTWFFVVDVPYLGVLAMAAAGGLLAFLRFNVTPAQTFMGDTGSLVVGLTIGLLTIEFIDHCSTGDVPAQYAFNNPVAVAVGILIIPLFDTIRVFTTRILRGQSPMKPDRRHIHHLLIDLGYSHMKSTAILAITGLLFVSVVMALDPYFGLHQLLFLEICVALLLTYFLHRSATRERRSKALPQSSVEERKREQIA